MASVSKKMAESQGNKQISVIVPVYNAEKHLERCLDSIIGQTYPHLQILLVDDGSDDNSGNICDQYAARDPRIHVLHLPHQGVSSARNAALSVIKGEYLGFVDSDDYCDPRLFEVLITAALAEQADAVRCGYFFEHIEESKPFVPNPMPKRCMTGWEAVIDSMVRTDASCHGTQLWNTLFRTDIVREPFLPLFDPCMFYGEDTDWLFSVLVRCERVVLLPDLLYYYVENHSSLTHQRTPEFYNGVVRHYKNTMSFLEKYDFPRFIKEQEAASWRNNVLDYGISTYVEKGIDYYDAASLPLNAFFTYKKVSLAGRIKRTILLIMIKLHMPQRLISALWNIQMKRR